MRTVFVWVVSTATASITQTSLPDLSGYAHLLTTDDLKSVDFDQAAQGVFLQAIHGYLPVVPAFGIAIVLGNHTVKSVAHGTGFSFASVNDTKPKLANATTATKFRIGSITKVFSSLLGFKAREMGLLSFDDRLNDTFPELGIEQLRASDKSGLPSFPFPIGSPELTVRQALMHLTGLNEGFDTSPSTRKEMADAVSTVGFAFAANVANIYSNYMTGIAGQVIAAHLTPAGQPSPFTDESWSALLDEHLLQGMGLRDTGGLVSDGIIAEGLLAAANTSASAAYTLRNLGFGAPCGSGYSTIDDMASFIKQVCGHGQPPGQPEQQRSVLAAATLREYLNIGGWSNGGDSRVTGSTGDPILSTAGRFCVAGSHGGKEVLRHDIW